MPEPIKKIEGYVEAAKIDKVLNMLIQKYPIQKENALQWLNFTRVIESSVKVIESLAINELFRAHDVDSKS